MEGWSARRIVEYLTDRGSDRDSLDDVQLALRRDRPAQGEPCSMEQSAVLGLGALAPAEVDQHVHVLRLGVRWSIARRDQQLDDEQPSLRRHHLTAGAQDR